MSKIPVEIAEKLGQGYRIAETDENGYPIIKPGEVIMVRDGLYIAYTENSDNNGEEKTINK